MRENRRFCNSAAGFRGFAEMFVEKDVRLPYLGRRGSATARRTGSDTGRSGALSRRRHPGAFPAKAKAVIHGQ